MSVRLHERDHELEVMLDGLDAAGAGGLVARACAALVARFGRR